MNFEDIPHCPVFYPTKKEFQNFQEYLEKCEAKAGASIIKVVPPKGWMARKDGYQNLDLAVQRPIEQTVHGTAGVYELIYFQRESRSLAKYKKNVESYDSIAEGKTPEEVEKLFWKTMRFNPPLYGADVPGSLFDKGTPWNLTEIDSLLTRGLSQKILGVNTPYLYMGAWKTMFGWHKEDVDLYSINFLHWGKPKCWYGIENKDSHILEEFARERFPDNYKECPEFIRHKTTMISPYILMERGAKIYKAVQNPGEFIITFAGTYHAGFNFGYNCAEAVNFALKGWLDTGRKAKSCTCSGDTVRINMSAFISQLKKNGYHVDDKENEEKSKEDEPQVSGKSSAKKSPEKSKPEGSKVRAGFTDVGNKVKRTGAKRKEKESRKELKKLGTISKGIDNWVECEKCKKWRRLPQDASLESLRAGFHCEFIQGSTCSQPEENWKENFKTVKVLKDLSKSKRHSERRKGLFASMKQKLQRPQELKA